MSAPPVIAFAVTSHGFGHAARACAVVEALWARDRALRPVIFSTVPASFFTESLGPAVRVEAVEVDVGLVQRDALTVDLEASVGRLRAFYAERDVRVGALAERMRALGTQVVVADIAPLGLAAARRLGRPSVLVESFTWDWIYRCYLPQAPGFEALADAIATDVASVSLRCQCAPCCDPRPGSLAVAPVARAPRKERNATRRALGVPTSAPAALVTMGGIPWHHATVPESETESATRSWLIIASDVTAIERRGRTVVLPHRSRFFHPDLVAAVDVVVAKLGYSTLAEVADRGRVLAYVPRPGFPESPVLEAWARRHLDTVRIDPTDFVAGRWRHAAEAALAGQVDRRSAPAPRRGGADQVAEAILDVLAGG